MRSYAENVIVVADDSHGVGGFGANGRGTEEVVGAKVDVLIGTLGKAFGVNGGYVVAGEADRSPTCARHRPSTSTPTRSRRAKPRRRASPSNASTAQEGRGLLDHLRAMTQRFRDGLRALGLETVAGEHPVVPLLVRDTARTAALVAHLRDSGILATGLAFPVVPKGEEEIRFQISADHTAADIDEALAALAQFRDKGDGA